MNVKLTRERVNQVGRSIHEARERAELSQRALAQLCGLTSADISRLETGKANPTLRMLLRIMDALRLDQLTIGSPRS